MHAHTVRLSIRKHLFHCNSISSWTTRPIFLVFVSTHAAHWAAWVEVICEKFNPQTQEEIELKCDTHELFSKWYSFTFVFFIFDDYLQKTNLYIVHISINNCFIWIFYFYVFLRSFCFSICFRVICFFLFII